MGHFVHAGDAMAEFRRMRGRGSQAEQAMEDLEVRLFSRSGLVVSPPPPWTPPPGLPKCDLCQLETAVCVVVHDSEAVGLCKGCSSDDTPKRTPIRERRSWWLWPVYLLAGRW